MSTEEKLITFTWLDPSTNPPEDRRVWIITFETTDITHVAGLQVPHWYVREHVPGLRPRDVRKFNGTDPECVDLIEWLNRNKEGAAEFLVHIPPEDFDTLKAVLGAPKVKFQVLELLTARVLTAA